MSFQQSLQNEMPVSYRNMLNGQMPTPFNEVVKIGQHDTFDRAFDNYHKRLESEKSDFNSSLTQIIKKRDDRISAENNEERRQLAKAVHRRFLCVEWIKTISFNIPTIVLFVISLILVGNPALILTNMHFGWIIGIYVAAFVVSFIVAGVVVRKSRRGDAYLFVKQRCAIMISGAMIFSALMSVGLAFISNHVYSFSDAESVNNFLSNIPVHTKVNISFSNDFRASEGLEIIDGQVVGIGNCNDRFIFIDKPVKEYAFDESKALNKSPNRKIILMNGCTQIGEFAFSKCRYINGCYFLQDTIPNIQYESFSYTWDYYKNGFSVYVPEKLLGSYENIDEITWQKSIIIGERIKTFGNYITLERDYT